MEIEHVAAMVNAMVSGTVFIGIAVYILAFWVH
jgi:hypothetical protein